MIRVRGLISSIKSSYLLNRTAFNHKVEDSWDKEFSQQNAKMTYLEKLLQTNQIRPYFIQKDIKELEKQDIYFYMYNKELFHRIPRQSKQQLIKNPNANTILKFHLALQLGTLNDEEVRLHLLESFNTSIKTVSAKDLLFCLQVVSSFKEAEQQIQNLELEKKFLEEEGTTFLRFVYLLSEMNVKCQTISPEVIVERMAQIDNLELETIYEVKTIAQFYSIKLPEPIEKRLTQSFSQKRKLFGKSQSNIIISLLPFYPQSANFLNITSLSIESYLSYLQFFLPQAEGEITHSVPKPIQHPIPASILAQAEIYQLYNIIKHRITLELQTVQTILNSIKHYYTNNLNCVIAIIRYLQKQEKMNPQAQSFIQKAIMKKIINQGQKALTQFKIVDIFKLLGYLSVNQLGTINFWKKTLRFVTDAIEDPQKYKNLTSEQQKKFVVYLFQIFKNKPFPREIQDQIINLTLLSLTINKWTLKEIFPLIISLKVNKITDNQLWFGIEQRINKIDLRHLDSHDDRRILKKIVYNFNLISKGSFEFWTEISKNLSKKEKQQILNGFKIPSTLAHTYFKI